MVFLTSLCFWMEKPSTVTSFLFFIGVLMILAGTTATAEKCRKSDILIAQAPTEPLPNGIPTYTVEIANMCASDCNISDIHLNCGKFSSARIIDPKIFKRLGNNNCLVNGGKPLFPGRVISFHYANTFLYPLSVSSALCN